MPSSNTLYASQVDGLGYDIDPASGVGPNLVLLPNRTIKISGTVSGGVVLSGTTTGLAINVAGNLSVDGIQVSNTIPTLSQTIQANGYAGIFGMPLKINAGIVFTVSAGAIIRTGP